jgi:hypothetical protein
MRYLLLLVSTLALTGLIVFWLKLMPVSLISKPTSNTLPQTHNSPTTTTLHPRVNKPLIPHTQSQSLEYQDQILEYQNQVINELQP